MMIDKVIKNVLELPGVDGACLLDKKGKILHNELPDFFLDDFLDDLSRRITALYEAVDENYVPCDDYLLKFPQKFIQLRRSRNVYMIVAVDPSVNLVSLRMVTNLVLKHVTPKILSELRASQEFIEPALPPNLGSIPEVKPTPEAEAPPPPARNSKRVLRPRPTRSFRGSQY